MERSSERSTNYSVHLLVNSFYVLLSPSVRVLLRSSQPVPEEEITPYKLLYSVSAAAGPPFSSSLHKQCAMATGSRDKKAWPLVVCLLARASPCRTSHWPGSFDRHSLWLAWSQCKMNALSNHCMILLCRSFSFWLHSYCLERLDWTRACYSSATICNASLVLFVLTDL
jgi:hypothetical protein